MSRLRFRYCHALVIILLVGLVTVFLMRQRQELGAGLALLQHVDPGWFIVLIATQAILLLTAAASYRTALGLLGHRLSIWRLVDIHLQRHVIGAVTPLGGPASVYVFVRALGQRGIGSNDAIFVMTIRSAIGTITFAALVIPTVLVSHPSPIFLAATAVLAAFVILLMTTLATLISNVALPDWITRRMPTRALEFAEQARQHGIRARDLRTLVALAIALNVGNVAMLYVGLRAVGQNVSAAPVFTGFAVGNLLQMVAPVAQGFGLVEMTMAAALQQAGIASAPAIAATLLYRLGDLWAPLALGLGVQLARSVGSPAFGRGMRRALAGMSAPPSAVLANAHTMLMPSGVSLVSLRRSRLILATTASGMLALLVAGIWQWPGVAVAISDSLMFGAISAPFVRHAGDVVDLLTVFPQHGTLLSLVTISQAASGWL